MNALDHLWYNLRIRRAWVDWHIREVWDGEDKAWQDDIRRRLLEDDLILEGRQEVMGSVDQWWSELSFHEKSVYLSDEQVQVKNDPVCSKLTL